MLRILLMALVGFFTMAYLVTYLSNPAVNPNNPAPTVQTNGV